MAASLKILQKLYMSIFVAQTANSINLVRRCCARSRKPYGKRFFFLNVQYITAGSVCSIIYRQSIFQMFIMLTLLSLSSHQKTLSDPGNIFAALCMYVREIFDEVYYILTICVLSVESAYKYSTTLWYVRVPHAFNWAKEIKCITYTNVCGVYVPDSSRGGMCFSLYVHIYLVYARREIQAVCRKTLSLWSYSSYNNKREVVVMEYWAQGIYQKKDMYYIPVAKVTIYIRTNILHILKQVRGI